MIRSHTSSVLFLHDYELKHITLKLRFVLSAWLSVDRNQVQRIELMGTAIFIVKMSTCLQVCNLPGNTCDRKVSASLWHWSVRWDEPMRRSADVQLHHRRLVFSAVCVGTLYTSASMKGGVRSPTLEGERSARGRVGLSQVCKSEAGPRS